MKEEQFEELLKFLENLDSNRMLSELAAGRSKLTGALKDMAFNANGEDVNGCQTKYAILKEEIKRIDELILLIIKES
jgi:hypothetical protein